MSTIIFNELDRHKTARYKMQGCEKAIIVRSDVPTFNMTVETMSLSDPHYRTNPLIVITQAGDYPFFTHGIDCGMELIFQVDDQIDPAAHLFVEIIYETCQPEKCCPCE